MDDMIGVQLSDYRIEARLGRGGMAEVFLARHVGLGRECALKVLYPELTRDEHFVERFAREARSAAQLDHPGIVPIYDMGRVEGRYFIAMKLLPGETLDAIAERGPLPTDQVLGYLDQIAAALDYAHGRGVIHRDIKPSNIIVDANGHVTLTDLGIARRVGDPGVTTAGMLLGTPAYMAPEQIMGTETSAQTDVYQLGALSFELLAGAPPFQAETAQAVLVSHLQHTPESLHARRPDLNPAVDAVITRAMAKDPAARYASAGELAEAMHAALSEPVVSAHSAAAAAPLIAATSPDVPAGAPPVTPPTAPVSALDAPFAADESRVRRPLMLGCAALVLVLLCGGAFAGGWYLTRDDDARRDTSVSFVDGTPPPTTPGEQSTVVAVDREEGATVESGSDDPVPTALPTSIAPVVILPTPPADAAQGATLAVGERLAYSGALTEAGQVLDFTFASAGGQRMFMDVLEGDTTSIQWSLIGPDGAVIHQNGVMSSSIGDNGPFELAAAGVHTIRVSSWDNSLGSFRFQLWDVPPDEEFEIAVGDVVAGALETPGRRDVYHFTGSAGQQVAVDVMAGEDTSILWTLTHESGTEVFRNGVMSSIIGDTAALELPADGRYLISVSAYYDVVGGYAFKLWDVPPPDEFEIAVGEEVRRDAPGPGAGLLEQPAVSDVYRFRAEAGTNIMMDVIEGETTNIWWTLAHESGTLVLTNQTMSAVIGDVGPILLEQGGTYIITVFGYYDATGPYAFMLTEP